MVVVVASVVVVVVVSVSVSALLAVFANEDGTSIELSVLKFADGARGFLGFLVEDNSAAFGAAVVSLENVGLVNVSGSAHVILEILPTRLVGEISDVDGQVSGVVVPPVVMVLGPPTPASSSSSAAKRRSRRSPMRVLDLACGKGGDLGKWTLHPRGMENYVGVDVARGSLVDAALRARRFLRPSNKKSSSSLRRCTFTLADLGHDVPGRKRSPRAKRMQRLLTWNGNDERPEDLDRDPVFRLREGGGVSESDKFDVVSIQFAIHYMMSTRTRARRFFHTVGSLLERGGNLIATTIDARVVAERLMGLGLDLHFDDEDRHAEVDAPENEERHGNGNKRRKVSEGDGATVRVGDGVCRLKFDTETLRRVFRPPGTPEDMFGLQYAFTLVEGSDHAAGVGEAVDLPEWLTPIPALTELAAEAGLELEYATNFHEFYEERKDPAKFPAAHNALYNMKVLNREGSISSQEWEVSRMYVAVKFRKVRESTIVLEEEEDLGEEEMMEEEEVS
mmetsp:Transcript_12548/g.26541  ORF Transcript_12548/g.26541 Transcript_12548/m.26541 type:complete len:506 (-) Transcript_12548:216-1733(-)